MIVLGIILMIGGIASYLWANNMQNSFEYKWYEVWGSSDYEYVDVILYIGIFSFVIGVILLIVGCTKRISKPDKSNYINSVNLNSDIYSNEDKKFVSKNVTCGQCGASIDKNVLFCPYCGCENKSKSVQNKFCGNCGAQSKENENFCSNCGYKF